MNYTISPADDDSAVADAVSLVGAHATRKRFKDASSDAVGIDHFAAARSV